MIQLADMANKMHRDHRHVVASFVVRRHIEIRSAYRNTSGKCRLGSNSSKLIEMRSASHGYRRKQSESLVSLNQFKDKEIHGSPKKQS